MKRCLVCECEREDTAFSGEDPICKKCVAQLQDRYDVKYSPPERISKIRGFIKLIAAVRALAVEDGELEDWEAYWLESPEWRLIWNLAEIDELRSF